MPESYVHSRKEAGTLFQQKMPKGKEEKEIQAKEEEGPSEEK
jgi:hypothetical protein